MSEDAAMSAFIGVAACVMSIAAAVLEGGTRWAFFWIAGISLVGVAIGIVLGRRG